MRRNCFPPSGMTVSARDGKGWEEREDPCGSQGKGSLVAGMVAGNYIVYLYSVREVDARVMNNLFMNEHVEAVKFQLSHLLRVSGGHVGSVCLWQQLIPYKTGLVKYVGMKNKDVVDLSNK